MKKKKKKGWKDAWEFKLAFAMFCTKNKHKRVCEIT